MLSPYHESVSALDMLRLLRLIDRHQPSPTEAFTRLDWSRAKLKRAVALVRALGVEVATMRRRDYTAYYELVNAGPFDIDRLRKLWRRRILQ